MGISGTLAHTSNPAVRLSAFGLHGRSRLLRFAILLVALWQVGTPLAPHTGTFSGATGNRPHWHATGDALELAHDETACPGCTIQQNSRTASHPSRLRLDAGHTVGFVRDAADQPVVLIASSFVFSRAPPSLA